MRSEDIKIEELSGRFFPRNEILYKKSEKNKWRTSSSRSHDPRTQGLKNYF